MGAKAIVCFTAKGSTAEKISHFRPKATIVAVTHNKFTYNSLALCWGVKPVMVKETSTLDNMLLEAEKIVKDLKLAKTGDKIVVTLGIPIQQKGMTNSIKITQIR